MAVYRQLQVPAQRRSAAQDARNIAPKSGSLTSLFSKSLSGISTRVCSSIDTQLVEQLLYSFSSKSNTSAGSQAGPVARKKSMAWRPLTGSCPVAVCRIVMKLCMQVSMGTTFIQNQRHVCSLPERRGHPGGEHLLGGEFVVMPDSAARKLNKASNQCKENF